MVRYSGDVPLIHGLADDVVDHGIRASIIDELSIRLSSDRGLSSHKLP